MTRQHFKAIADALAESKPLIADAVLEQWQRDCLALAQVCKQFNSGFQKDRFLKACNYQEAA